MSMSKTQIQYIAIGFFLNELINPMPITLDIWDFLTDSIEEIQQ